MKIEFNRAPTTGRVLRAAAAVLGLTGWHIAVNDTFAQAYPSRPIRVVSPFAPGGGSDIMARVVAQKLTEGLKQQAFVENRGGGGGRPGTNFVAKSPPDGYTLLVTGSGSMILASALYENLPYNVQRDFAPVTMLVASAAVLVMHPTVPVRSVKQLIALARSRPGVLNYASPGAGAMGHLAGELFQSMASVKLVHVPYKGTGPGLMSVVGGETDLAFSNIMPALPAIQGGRLRAIAVTSPRRSSMLREVPTVAEAGVPGYEASSYYGLLAPAGTPVEIVGRLNATIVAGLGTAETRKTLEADGSTVLASTPKDMAHLVRSETEKWAKIIKAIGLKPE